MPPDSPSHDQPEDPSFDEALVDLFGAPTGKWEEKLDELCRQQPHRARQLRAAYEAFQFSRRAMAGDRDDGGTPQQIGDYRVLEEIGIGGMGRVFLARQLQPVRRLVAIKVIKPGFDGKDVLARFRRELQALASMDHGNIAKVYDAGETEQGRPYFAMEYVPGLPLTRYCDEKQLTIDERLRLFQSVCHGVQHAHQKGVIHRDLKPGNILVREEDDRGVPKIIDFGLARAIDRDSDGTQAHTELDRALGTPEYMSPEQAGLSPLDIDTRTDVYSLGVILYELLVGSLPFTAQELRRAGRLEMMRKIREDDPPSPRQRVSTAGDDTKNAAQRRRLDTRSLQRQVRGDLDWVTMKALQKERARRYPTALSLAEDIERHLHCLPVLAGPPSATYRFGRWLRRHRGKVAAGLALFLVSTTGFVVSSALYVQARRAERATQLAADQISLGEYEKEAADLWPARESTIPAMLDWLSRARELGARLPEHRSHLGARELEVGERRRRGEASEELRMLELRVDRLRRFVDGLARMVHEPDGLLFAVDRRLQQARSIRERSIDAHADEWRAAIEAIEASDRYGFRIEPQVGLVPLGFDPQSRLCEFAAIETGTIPVRTDGELQVDEGSALILVLIPGGDATIGSQGENQDGPNYDASAEAREGPLLRVKLSPFFLSKFEMTQAQWARIIGSHPSNYRVAPRGGPLHPVERVSWDDCQDTVRRIGLTLPTETQWEYACRAGAATPWSTAEAELDRTANTADAAAQRAGAVWPDIDPALDDGFALHAPVGSLRANAFGLHDMHGNVWEWCQNGYTENYAEGARPGDGQPERAQTDNRILRGGGFMSDAHKCRSSHRHQSLHSNAHVTYGVRPSRPVDGLPGS